VKIHSNPAIEGFFTAIQKTGGSFKPVKLHQLHITLKFFGEVGEEKLEEISGLVKERTTGHGPFSFGLAGCGAFPNENYLKVLWVGMEDAETLVSLGTGLQKSFEGLGFKRDRFSPHLTLFRVKSPKNKTDIQKVLGDHRETHFGRVEVSKLLLMESQLTPKGPIYSVVERFPLGDPL